MAENQTGRRLRQAWQAAGWLLVVLVVYLSLAPRLPDALDAGDKAGHLLAYGTLMLWFAQLHAGPRRIAVAIGLVLFGVVMEYIQGWSGFRIWDVGDIVANSAGVALGWIAAPPRSPHILLRLERWLA